MHFKVVNLLAAVLVLLLVCGCAEPVTNVTGKVTLDGKPLTIGQSQRGTVVFHPAGGGALATALITNDGSYRATTGGSSPLKTGEYLVAVRVLEVIPRGESVEASGKPLTPAVYADPTTSGIKFNIQPGDNVCDIALSSDAGPATPPESEAHASDSPNPLAPDVPADDSENPSADR